MTDKNDNETADESGVDSSDLLDETWPTATIRRERELCIQNTSWRARFYDMETHAREMEVNWKKAQSELDAVKNSVVDELNQAEVTRTYDDEEIHCGNYLQGIRILRDRANSSNK